MSQQNGLRVMVSGRAGFIGGYVVAERLAPGASARLADAQRGLLAQHRGTMQDPTPKKLAHRIETL